MKNFGAKSFLRDFPAPPVLPPSWKQFYQYLFNLNHPKTISVLNVNDVDGTHLLLSAPNQEKLMETIVTIYNYNLEEHECLLYNLNSLIYEINKLYDLNILERFFELETQIVQLIPIVTDLISSRNLGTEEAKALIKYFSCYYFNPFFLTHLLKYPEKLQEILKVFNFLFENKVGTEIMRKIPTVEELQALVNRLHLDPGMIETTYFAYRSSGLDLTEFTSVFNEFYVKPLILNPIFAAVDEPAETRFLERIGGELLEFMICQSDSLNDFRFIIDVVVSV